MRRRTVAPDYSGPLPVELAAGPGSWPERRAWDRAGRAWSRANLGTENDWLALLPAEVRYATSARGRLRALDDGRSHD